MTYQGSSFDEEDVAGHIEVLVGRYGSVAEAWEMVKRPGYAPETPLWNAIRASIFYRAMESETLNQLEHDLGIVNHQPFMKLNVEEIADSIRKSALSSEWVEFSPEDVNYEEIAGYDPAVPGADKTVAFVYTSPILILPDMRPLPVKAHPVPDLSFDESFAAAIWNREATWSKD